MEDRDLRDEISDLEERVEELAESLERSRKMIFTSKMSMVIGAARQTSGVMKAAEALKTELISSKIELRMVEEIPNRGKVATILRQ